MDDLVGFLRDVVRGEQTCSTHVAAGLLRWISAASRAGAGGRSCATKPLALTGREEQIVNGGGGMITAPRIVPILYAADPNAAALQDFAAKLGTSTYFKSVTAEYGVTGVTVAPPVVISDAPPATASDVDACSG